ncbi:dihydrodipicolinate reductase [Nioella aestuarii]|uniref:dihydrodipicolinate reductase n=1 Tax=Nioella aestuarii TaxID=1662864 RepID=UPI003D7F4BAA
MRLFACTLLAAVCASTVAAAEEFQPIRDRDTFVEIVNGRELSLGLFGVRLSVSDDGRIEGEAIDWPLIGHWEWRDGYFCREMDWSGREIPFNCQLVEIRNAREMRFTVDRGEGRSATFRIR